MFFSAALVLCRGFSSPLFVSLLSSSLRPSLLSCCRLCVARSRPVLGREFAACCFRVSGSAPVVSPLPRVLAAGVVASRWSAPPPASGGAVVLRRAPPVSSGLRVSCLVFSFAGCVSGFLGCVCVYTLVLGVGSPQLLRFCFGFLLGALLVGRVVRGPHPGRGGVKPLGPCSGCPQAVSSPFPLLALPPVSG